MDPVYLLFCRSWLHVVLGKAPARPEGSATDEDRFYRAVDGGVPDWRRVFAPISVIGVLVLVGALFSTGT